MVLNVCLKTEDAKSLGLDLHVCEIQLGLIRMARLKVRYIKILFTAESKTEKAYLHVIEETTC